jgi:hypothetical protein
MRSLHLVPSLTLFLLLTAACSSSDPTSPPAPGAATVTFEYRAATAPDLQVRARFPACFDGVGTTHIHPGWRNFARIDLITQGAMLWSIRFTDVPVGSEQRIRISDGNTCSATNPTGASTTNVFANGVLLARIVPTPGAGTEPGLAFTVAANGTVTP